MHCKRCDSRCCKRYTIPVTTDDVLDICRQGHDISDFVAFYPVGSLESEYPDARLTNGYFYMGLKKHSGGACVFLEDGAGCTIHGSHPLICRIYPFDPYTMKMRKKHVCPVDERPGRDLGETFGAENMRLCRYIEAVDMWNRTRRTDRSEDAFLKYLLDRTSL